MTKPVHSEKEPLPEVVDQKTRRRIKAQRDKDKSLLFGFGMFGIVGWSIAIPTVIGTVLGHWLDSRHIAEGRISWTLSGLFLGLIVGALIAWHWVSREGGPQE